MMMLRIHTWRCFEMLLAFGVAACAATDHPNEGHPALDGAADVSGLGERPEDSSSIDRKAITGVVQKGPFVRGSTVTVQELDGRLSPTGRTFGVTTSDDLGGFDVPVNLASRYVEVIATGYYYDELGDRLSASPLTLRTISDVQNDGEVHVNVLTTMSVALLRASIAQGEEFGSARAKAEPLVLESLGFTQVLPTMFDQLDIASSGDPNALLLAASLLVESYAASRGGSTVAELTQVLSQVGAALVDGGTNAPALESMRAARCRTAVTIDTMQVRQNLSAHYAAFGVDVHVPPFESILEEILQTCRDAGGRDTGIADDANDEVALDAFEDRGDASVDGGRDALPERDVARSHPWSPTGDMVVAREQHTSDILANGQVLVAGGESTGVLDSAELYDPATELWSETTRMTTPRVNHSSAALVDGKILVAGGYTALDGIPTAKAEFYDPRTSRWTAAPSMLSPRVNFALARLSDGRILAAGGRSGSGSGYTASTEIFDPDFDPDAGIDAGWDGGPDAASRARGPWSPAGSMAAERTGHVLVVLEDGTVLAAGGFGGPDFKVHSSADLYDPQSGRWAAAGSMSVARIYPVAVALPGGKVLVAGGRNDSNGSEKSAELYDSSTNSFAPTGTMASARQLATATLLPSGKVLVVGGDDGATQGSSASSVATAELYDPATGTWTTAGMMAFPRQAHAASLLLSGWVLVTGGDTGGSPRITKTAELFAPAAVGSDP